MIITSSTDKLSQFKCSICTQKGEQILPLLDKNRTTLFSNSLNDTDPSVTMRFVASSIALIIIIGFLGGLECRRARGRSRSKSKLQIGLPITGKYRDPESDKYYNNNNGAKIVLASHFDYEYILGQKIAFLCVAKGNPRPHVTWYKDGSEIFTHLYLHIHEWHIGTDTIKSKLEIDPATQMDAGLYECTADNMYSIDRRSFKTDFSIAFD